MAIVPSLDKLAHKASDREAEQRRLADLELAVAALIALVRAEYPAGKRLAEIAYLWGDGMTDEQIKALDRLEEGGPYLWPNSR